MADKDKNMDTTNIVIFNNDKPKEKQQTMDSKYKELIDYDELRKKYWSHICPGIGMVSQPEPVCQRCLQTKPKSKE